MTNSIIAIEGLDKSGKYTTQQFIVQWLQKHTNKKIVPISFPRYDTPVIGDIIRNYLVHHTNDAATFELAQALDKRLFKFDYERHNNTIFVLDRYLLTQKVYAKTNGVPDSVIHYFGEGMPQPRLTIYLDIDVNTSQSRKGQHGENDRYEKDKKLLQRVKDEYTYLIKNIKKDQNYSGVITSIDATQPKVIIQKELKTILKKHNQIIL